MPRKYAKQFTEDEVEEVLHKAHGIISSAAKMLSTSGRKISRQGLTKYIDKSVRLQEVLEEETETLKDFAESELLKLIRAGDKSAIMFFLKCRAKERGYIERQEFTGKDGTPISGKLEPVDIKIKIVDPVAKTETPLNEN